MKTNPELSRWHGELHPLNLLHIQEESLCRGSDHFDIQTYTATDTSAMKGVGTRDLCDQGVQVCEPTGPAVDYSPQYLRTISGLSIFCCFTRLGSYSVVSAGVNVQCAECGILIARPVCESRSRVIAIVMML